MLLQKNQNTYQSKQAQGTWPPAQWVRYNYCTKGQVQLLVMYVAQTFSVLTPYSLSYCQIIQLINSYVITVVLMHISYIHSYSFSQLLLHKRMSIYNLQRFVYNLQSFNKCFWHILLTFVIDIHLLVIIRYVNLYINIIH